VAKISLEIKSQLKAQPESVKLKALKLKASWLAGW
jgi:hypothetical protein